MASAKSAATIAVILVMAVSAVAVVSVFQLVGNSGILGNNGTGTYGAVAGNVSIGPFCPVERLNQTCGVPDVTYSSRSLVLSPRVGASVYVELHDDGSFFKSVPANFYSVSLTNCTFVGCRYELPITITVTPNSTTRFNVSIDTGMR